MSQFTRLNQESRSGKHFINNIQFEHSKSEKSFSYKHSVLSECKLIRLKYQLEAILSQQRSKNEVLSYVRDMQNFSEGDDLPKGKTQLYCAFSNDARGGVTHEHVHTFSH